MAAERISRSRWAERRRRHAPTPPSVIDVSGAAAAAPLSLGSQGQTHGSARATLERAVHRARVPNEIRAGPWIPTEELVRQHVAFQSIARRARRDEVTRSVRPSVRHRVYVIERRNVQRQGNGAVDAASAAVTHGSVLESTLDGRAVEMASAAR